MWRVDRRLKDDSLCSLSLHGSEGRSSTRASGRCQRRSSRKQRHDSDSECRRDGRGSGDVGEWCNESTRFVLECCWCETQPFRDRRFCWQGQRHHHLDHRGKATNSAVADQKSVTSSLRLPSRHRHSSICLVSDDHTNCEFVDVGGGHKAWLLLRRTAIGAQSVVKTMELLVGNLTAAVVILGNYLQTAIQRLHIGNSQIRARCLGKAQAEVQLNSLKLSGSGTDMGGAY